MGNIEKRQPVLLDSLSRVVVDSMFVLKFEKSFFCSVYKIDPDQVLDIKEGLDRETRKILALEFFLRNLDLVMDNSKDIRIICI